MSEKRLELFGYALNSVRASAPGGLAGLNEAERDKIHLQKATTFMIANPLTTLMLVKAAGFYFLHLGSRVRPDRADLMSMLALVGPIVAFKDRSVLILALLVLAYLAPYIVTGPFFYR